MNVIARYFAPCFLHRLSIFERKTALLFNAIDANDAERIPELIHRGAKLTKKNKDGQTAMSKAIIGLWRPGLRVLDALIVGGCDINVQHHGSTILHFVAGKLITHALAAEAPVCRQLEWAISTLLHYGADIDARSQRDGGTPLHWAISVGRSPYVNEAARVLIERGADLDTPASLDCQGRCLYTRTSNGIVRGATPREYAQDIGSDVQEIIAKHDAARDRAALQAVADAPVVERQRRRM
jgi:ankyrin repeat protein